MNENILTAMPTKVRPPIRISQVTLGRNVVLPHELLGFVWPRDYIDYLESSLPFINVLNWCRDNDFALVPGPSEPMALYEIEELFPAYLFDSYGSPWYSRDGNGRAFSSTEKVQKGWIIFRKTLVPGSLDKSAYDHLKTFPKKERLPNAAEIVWAIIVWKIARGIRLFQDCYGRTSSRSTYGGAPVIVGNFAEKAELQVSYYRWGRRPDLGLFSLLTLE